MENMIRRALDKAGYTDDDPTEENLRSCVADYVDCGAWRDVDMEDVPDLSVTDMIRALIRL